jgi:hypothetical protein
MSDTQPSGGAPAPYKPFNAGKIAGALVVTLLISWGIIGGVVAWGVKADWSGTAKEAVSNATGKGKSTAEGFERYASMIEVASDTLTVGDHKLRLTGSAAEEWEFVDDRRADQQCANSSSLDIFCRIGHLALRNSGTDASMLSLSIAKSVADAKGLADFGVGTEIDVPGASAAYLYNSVNVSERRNYAEDHASLIELDTELTVVIIQTTDTVMFNSQEDFDSYTATDRYKLMMSEVDNMIDSLDASK